MENKKIGILGLGRFGRLWGNILADHTTVYGYDPQGPKGTQIKMISKSEFFEKCDIIFVCVPISAFEAVIKENAAMFKPGTVVVDVCSIKEHPVEVMKKHLPENVQIVATHPMFGPDSAKRGIQGLPIMMANVRADEHIYNALKEFLAKRLWVFVVEMSIEEHDRQAAKIQGITHLVGRLLDTMDLHPSPIATKGYKALLNLVDKTCNDTKELFYNMHTYNRHTTEIRQQLEDNLMELNKEIKEQLS